MNGLFLLLILVGGIIGIIAGLAGIGGTTLLIPCLIWLFLKMHYSLDLAVKMAFGSALLVSAITALTGFLIHRTKIEIKWGLILPLALSVVAGAFFGSRLAHFIRGSDLLNIFILALFVIAFYLLLNPKQKTEASLNLTMPVIIFTGLGLGLIASLAGLGGGLFTIIVFTLIFKQPMHEVIGISTFVQVCGALSAAAGYMINGYVNFLVVLAMLIGGIPLARLGAILAHKMEATLLQRVFGAILLLMGITLTISRVIK